MGENHFETLPVVLYGAVLFYAAAMPLVFVSAAAALGLYVPVAAL